MQYTQFIRAAIGMVALILFISSASVADARTDPFTRIQHRLEEVQTRVAERLEVARDRIQDRQQAVCDRFESRGIPALPSFCDDEPLPAPTLTLGADPSTINEGDVSELSWESEHADSCTASGGWSGNKALSGMQSVSPTSDTTYVLTCEGDGEEVERSVTVYVDEDNEEPAPTLEFTAEPEHVAEGATSTLSWDADNADTCTASAGWSGGKTVSGSQIVTPHATTTYTLTCEGVGGTVEKSVMVGVTPESEQPRPVVEMSASPMTIDEGATTTLSWESEDAELCISMGGWSGIRALSGSLVVEPATTTTYALDCSNETGTSSDSVTVTVTPDDTGPSASTTILITEVYYDVASEQSESANEWIELYNAGDEAVTMDGWLVRDSGGFTDALPTVSIDPGEVVIVTNATSTLNFFTIPEGTHVIYLGSPIGNGLGNTGDAVELVNADDVVVDAVSWGTSLVAFDPSVPNASEGESIERCPADVDTDTALDWVVRATPTPGETPSDCGEDTGLPIVTISADPAMVSEGGTTTLSWESEHADLCSASNGWSGDKALSGTEIVSPTATTTYSISCGNEVGTTTDAVIVAVINEPSQSLPTIDFSADPMTIVEGATSTLVWETMYADACVGSGGWNGTLATSGASVVSPATTTTYALECANDAGTTTESVTVTVSEESSYGGIVLSEIYYDTDTEHGSDTDNEWIEIYNGNADDMVFSGWIQDTSGAQDMIATTTIPAHGYLLIANASSTAEYWDIPEEAVVIYLENSIGNSLGNTGDSLSLYAWDGTLLDAVSWGDDTSIFDPAAPDVADGNSLARDPVTTDTDTALDWSEQSTPTPGGAVSEAPFEEADSVVISEVYFDVDDAHGTEKVNEWIEIYNPTATSVDLVGWRVGASSSTADVLATSSLMLAPGAFIIVAADTATATATYWDFSSASAVVSLGSLITSGGLANSGDEVRLYDATLTEIDAMSYGSNTNVFDPAPDASEGQSLSREPRNNDTDSGSDWIAESTPNPGS